MTPKRELSILFSTLQKRNEKLRMRLANLSFRTNVEVDALVTSVVIDAQGAWQSYLRAYYISSVYGAKFQNTRVQITAGFSDEDSALKKAYTVYNRKPFTKNRFTRRDDPPWHDLSFYKKLFDDVGASNYSVVVGAFAYNGLFLSMLPTARNFYAHRCDETLKKLSSLPARVGYVAPGKMHPTEVFRYEVPGRNMNVLRDWLFDVDYVADLMCN